MLFSTNRATFLLAALIAAPCCQGTSMSAPSLLQRASATEKTLDVDEAHEADEAPEASAPKEDAKAANGTNASSAKANATAADGAAGKGESEGAAKAANGTDAAPATNDTSAANITNASDAKPAEPSVPSGGCVTKQDPRAKAWWAKTAKPGTACVFGVDPRDEGKHCIPEMEFGSMGWCFTKKDKSEWGSCGEACPLYGHHKTVGKQIDGLAARVDAIIGNLSEAAGSGAATEPAASPAASGGDKEKSGADAPAANGTNATATESKAKEGAKEGAKKGAKKEAAALVQVAARSGAEGKTAQMEAALALAQKAERQTEIWTSVVERMLERDASLEDEDFAQTMQEAVKKARAWSKVASKRSAQVVALMQVAES